MRLRNSKCVCQMQLRSLTRLELLQLKDSGQFLDKILYSEDLVQTGVHHIVMASLSPKLKRIMQEDYITLPPLH